MVDTRLGQEWIEAITAGTVERLAEFCRPEVTSHLLTPKRYIEYTGTSGLVEKFRQWFGACSDIHVEDSRVEIIGERLGIFYRFNLLEEGRRLVIEQQIFCTLENDRIMDLRLLCSGFQPVETPVPVTGYPANRGTPPSPGRPALLEMHTSTENGASTCALLTPAIKSRLREMETGQVLEVRVDDPAARSDIEAWCRLSGNPLLEMHEAEGQELRFLIQKK